MKSFLCSVATKVTVQGAIIFITYSSQFKKLTKNLMLTGDQLLPRCTKYCSLGEVGKVVLISSSQPKLTWRA